MEALGATTDASLFGTTLINSVIEIPRSAMKDKVREKKKEQEEEELKQPKHGSCSTVLLDLGLSNKDSNIGSLSSTPPILELDLIGSLGSGGRGGGSAKTEGEPWPASPEPEPRVFSFNYCRRKLYRSQAHKRECLVAKRAQGGSSSVGLADSPMHRFPLLLHGAFGGRPLGIQVHSMLHKPYTAPAVRLQNGQHGWYQPLLAAPVIHPQPSVGRSFAENCGAVGMARDTAAMFNQEAVAAAMEGYQWGGGGDQLSGGKEETQEIDLTLKL